MDLEQQREEAHAHTLAAEDLTAGAYRQMVRILTIATVILLVSVIGFLVFLGLVVYRAHAVNCQNNGLIRALARAVNELLAQVTHGRTVHYPEFLSTPNGCP